MKKIILATAVLFSCSVFANPADFKAFKTQYPDFKGASCKTCHTTPPQLNPYGMDLQKAAADANALTAKDFIAVEALDSDGDTATNAAEIKASSQPGNKDSTPAAN